MQFMLFGGCVRWRVRGDMGYVLVALLVLLGLLLTPGLKSPDPGETGGSAGWACWAQEAPAGGAPTEPSAAAAAAPAPSAVSAPVALGPDGLPLISNVFFESDLRQALADIAAQAGVVIIADATVQGSVTAELKEVPLERALEMVLQVGGFAFVKMEGYYLAGAPDPSNPNYPLFCKTELVSLRYTAPEAILALLSGSYGRYLSIDTSGAQPGAEAPTERAAGGFGAGGGAAGGRALGGPAVGPGFGVTEGRAAAGPGAAAPRYRVLITAPAQMIERIKRDIAVLDQPTPQVMLEAAVIEVSSEALENLGINWATRWIEQDLTPGEPNLIYSTIANTEMAALTALVQKGEARLRANPRVATMEGQTAELEVGKENYFTIISGPVNFPYATLEKITSGILLRITPRVLEAEKEIVAVVQPEVRDVTGKGQNGLPEITFRRALTNLRVKDGQSIVIGGLMVETESRGTAKIPLLGDIPVLGNLFRTRSGRATKTDVAIVITPHIVTDWATTPGAMPTGLAEETPEAPLPPALTPRERIRRGLHHWSPGGQEPATPPTSG